LFFATRAGSGPPAHLGVAFLEYVEDPNALSWTEAHHSDRRRAHRERELGIRAVADVANSTA
jgi:hypothetical protein